MRTCACIFIVTHCPTHLQQILYHGTLGSFATLEGFPHGFTYFELGNINCTGNETSLFDCQRTGLTRAICSGPQVGVSCVHFTCANGDVRLQGGTSTFGRLEVCVDNAWGTVCSDTDNVMTARVACRQLGLPTEGRYTRCMLA